MQQLSMLRFCFSLILGRGQQIAKEVWQPTTTNLAFQLFWFEPIPKEAFGALNRLETRPKHRFLRKETSDVVSFYANLFPR